LVKSNQDFFPFSCYWNLVSKNSTGRKSGICIDFCHGCSSLGACAGCAKWESPFSIYGLWGGAHF